MVQFRTRACAHNDSKVVTKPRRGVGPVRSHDAVIRVYDAVDNVVKTREHSGGFKEL
jgi:hypothetical protein